ncbi:hypothetical protein VTO73DRAFT_4740 [Trametes versicolor]
MSIENASVTSGPMLDIPLTPVAAGILDLKHQLNLQLMPHIIISIGGCLSTTCFAPVAAPRGVVFIDEQHLVACTSHETGCQRRPSKPCPPELFVWMWLQASFVRLASLTTGMSSDPDAAAELVLLYQAADSNFYWTSCAFAYLLYDYILTFRHEMRFVWGRKFSAATVLLSIGISSSCSISWISSRCSQYQRRCPGIGRFITVLEVIPYIIWATFSALRAYALSSRTALIGVIIFILSLVPAGVNAYFFSAFIFINLDPPSNCTALSDITPELSKIVCIAMNVVHMTLNTVKPNNIVQQASYVTILENPITSILISRFILNLRAVDHGGAEGGGASAE